MNKKFIILALILITLGVFFMNMTPEERVAVISTKHGDKWLLSFTLMLHQCMSKVLLL